MKIRNGEDPEWCVPPPTVEDHPATEHLSAVWCKHYHIFPFLTLCFLAGFGAEHSLTKDAPAHVITMTLSVLMSDLMSSHMMAWEQAEGPCSQSSDSLL